MSEEIKDMISRIISTKHEFKTMDNDAPLTGAPLCISGEELVYIVMELMEKYNIQFDSEDFSDYRFNTVNGIIAAVMRHMHGDGALS